METSKAVKQVGTIMTAVFPVVPSAAESLYFINLLVPTELLTTGDSSNTGGLAL